MRILVTGAAGFVGSALCEALVEAGRDVTGLDNYDPSVHNGSCARHVKYDIAWIHEGVHCWMPAHELDFQAVVHCAANGGVGFAARNPGYLLRSNCLGTANLCRILKEQCPRLRRAILASSFSVYGNNYAYTCQDCAWVGSGIRHEADLAAGHYDVYCPDCRKSNRHHPLVPVSICAIREDTAPSPLELYATSKYAQEVLWRVLPQATILRFSSVYGPRMRLNDGEATIIAKLAGYLQRGERPQLFEDGQQIRDWVAVADIAATVVKLLDTAEVPPLMNVCSGYPVSLAEACTVIAEALDKALEPEIVGGYRPGDMRHCLGDKTMFAEFLGRNPQVLTVDNARWAFGV